MALDPYRDDLIVGVVGAGAMGRGIAQVACVSGCLVKLYDADQDTAANAFEFISNMLSRAAHKGRLSDTEARAARDRIDVVDGMNGLASCHVVFEAVIEDLALKHAVFRDLEKVVADDTILATNTSSLTVASVATVCRKPQRIAGCHFFNPVPIMELVEVAGGAETGLAVTDALMDLGRRFGRQPVHVADVPGFLVNQIGRGYVIEAAHLAEAGMAGFTDIDCIMRDAAGFPMGPFELLDLVGLDVSHPATERIYEGTGRNPRFRPSPLLQQRMEDGLLGRKTGAGFYEYLDGRATIDAEPPAPDYDGRPVWAGSDELSSLVASLDATLDKGAEPGNDSLILVAPLGDSAAKTAANSGLDPTRTVAIDTLFGLSNRRTLMPTSMVNLDVVASAHGLVAVDGVPVTVIADCPGFIAPRIVAMIVNLGCAAAEAETAKLDDIDRSVTMGLGYPHGPLAFGDALGPDRILKVLLAVHDQTGDSRYQPTQWLSERAKQGVSLSTPN